MSMELHAFLPMEEPPDRSRWQNEITRLGLPIVLEPDPLPFSGFTPMLLEGERSGVEMMFDDVADMMSTYPKVAEHTPAARSVLSFYWGGDMGQLACAFGAGAGLVAAYGATLFSPIDGSFIHIAEAAAMEARSALTFRTAQGSSHT